MGLETEYMEYGIELSLTVLGVSAVYFVNFSSPLTFLSLMFIPVLFGYTTYISREGFNRASLISLMALIFTVVGGITAVAALIYSIGNVLVSGFSGGTRFKDFYASTSIPLLVIGIILGVSIYGYGAVNPDFKHEKISYAGQKIGEMAQKTFEDSGIMQSQKTAQLTLINQTASAAAGLTVQKVLNKSNPSIDVRRALMESQREVPREIYVRTRRKMNQQSVDISGRVSTLFQQNFSGKKFVLVIPLVAGLFYSLQPLLGVLTALFASLLLRLDD